ncbi:hypothetical protein ACHAPO_009280 [Fusarium lateritium]
MEIIERITESSSGTFLLAELHLRSLKNKKSPKALRSSLAKLSVGSDAYDSAYQDAMTRIAGLGPESEALAKQALLILIFAREPLRTEDLVYALSIEPDSETIDDTNVPDIEDVAGVCAGLIIVDKESNIVRLVHKSAQEYFERHQAQLFPQAGEIMARLCMKYLSLAASIPGFDKSVEASWPPFWRYADMNWTYHSHRAEGDNKATEDANVNFGTSAMVPNLHSVSTLAIDLLARDIAGCLSSALGKACREGRHALVDLLLTVNDYDLNRQPYNTLVASPSSDDDTWSEKGTTGDVEQDRDDGWSLSVGKSVSSISSGSSGQGAARTPDQDPEDGCFLIIIAAKQGDDAMVKILLNHGADPNLVSTSNSTALCIATWNGHYNTVSRLLEHPAIDPDLKCTGVGAANRSDPSIRWTPLLAAAYRGHLKCTRLLLDKAQRNYRDEIGRNVACLAAQNGSGEVIKELLKWSDIELDPTTGTKGVSALTMALISGNDEAALLLIPHSDTTCVYSTEDRPLNLAAETGCIEAIQLLLARITPVNTKGSKGRTVLHSAIENLQDETIKLILKHPDIDINIQDDDGNTPLINLVDWHLWFIDEGLGLIELLLSRPELDINVENLKGNTALLLAASNGEFHLTGDNRMFNSLFNYPGVHKEHRNKCGETILFHAVMTGSDRVRTIATETQLLHQFSEVDDEGETLLSRAAKNSWTEQLAWEYIAGMSPTEFMHRKNSQSKTPQQLRDDTWDPSSEAWKPRDLLHDKLEMEFRRANCQAGSRIHYERQLWRGQLSNS